MECLLGVVLKQLLSGLHSIFKGQRIMVLKIKIPKEFEKHFNMDRFKESLERISADIHFELFNKSNSRIMLSGRYEMELAEMLRDSMSKAEIIKE